MEPDKLLTELEKSLDSEELLQQIKQPEEDVLPEEKGSSQTPWMLLLLSILLVEVGIVVYALQASQRIVVISPEEQALLEQQKAEKDLKTSQRLALEAKNMIKYPPLPLATWQEAEGKLLEAIKLLEETPKDTTVKKQADKLLQTYRLDYNLLREKLIVEQIATTKLFTAKKLGIEASVIVQNPPHSKQVWQEALAKWEEAIDLLQEIPTDTFVAPEAVERLDLYRTNYRAVNSRLEINKKFN
ncbi:MAG: hypothetical protein WBA93_14845 [Microcoleaceae cyanobacterium]